MAWAATDIVSVNCTTNITCERDRAKIAGEFVNDFRVHDNVKNLLVRTTENNVMTSSLVHLIKEKDQCNVRKLQVICCLYYHRIFLDI